MTDWILSSSVLIAAVIALRAVTKGRISMRLRYGLWALVLVRLLIPGNFIPSDFSIEKVALFFERQPQVQQISQQLNTPQQSYDAVYREVVKEHYEVYYPQEATVPEALPESFTAALPAQEQAQIRQEAQLRVEQSAPIYSLKQILLGIWILGMAVSGTFLLTVNLSFARRLKRTRTPVEADTPVPVYQSVMAETPCLFGLFRPVIYITGEAADNPRALSHILAHESCHYRHKDHIWAILRCFCLVLHWYNPLVWAAFSLSRRDCELACDEAAIARIGESNRHEYGRTLVDMTCVKQSPTAALLTATTMLSDRNTLVQRIRQIAKKPKVLISAVVTAVIIAAVAVGCTFTGAPDEPTQPTEITKPTQPPETTAPSETAKPTEPAETQPSADGYKNYKIGQDLSAGTYAFIPEDPDTAAYFRLNNNGTVVTETFTGHFIWSLNRGASLTLQGCEPVPVDTFTVSADENGSYGPGMYRIGIDIPAGSYVITPAKKDTPAVWKLFRSISQPPYHNDGYSNSFLSSSSISLSGENSPREAILLQDCTLTPLVSETFTLPELPTVTKIYPMPPYNSALVTPYWEQGLDIVEHATFFISIPQIWPFSQDAIDCQEEIWEALLPTLKYYEETAGYTDIYDVRLLPMSEKVYYNNPAGISYSSYIYKDILSIVVETLTQYDMTEHFVYNLDLTTGKRIGNEALLDRLGIGSVDLKESLRAAYIKRYNSSSGEQLDKTLSKENLDAVRLYVTNDGTLMAAARIYSIAGADSYMHLIPVHTPPTLSGRSAIRSLHADWNYQPGSTPEATARSIVEHLQGTGQILLVEYDHFMTLANITDDFINSETGKEYGLTAEFLQDHFRCVNVLYQQNSTEIFVTKITLMQDEENGLWYPWDMLSPYSVGSYPKNDRRLATYTALFDSTTGNGRMRQMALTSFYERPEDADIPLLLSTDFSRGKLTEAEKTFLRKQGFALTKDIQSHSADEISSILQTVFGKVYQADLSALTYYPETDTYYCAASGSQLPDIDITRYRDLGNGIVKLYYTCQNNIHYGYENGEFSVTIREANGTYQIISNHLPE